MNPEVLLLDEPTSALDPKATASKETCMLSISQHPLRSRKLSNPGIAVFGSTVAALGLLLGFQSGMEQKAGAVEAVATGKTEKTPKRELTLREQEEREQKEKIIRKLVRPTLNGPPRAEVLKTLIQELSKLPLVSLRTLEKHGDKVFILQGGPVQKDLGDGVTLEYWEKSESLLDAGIFSEVNTEEYAKPEMLEKVNTAWVMGRRFLNIKQHLEEISEEKLSLIEFKDFPETFQQIAVLHGAKKADEVHEYLKYVALLNSDIQEKDPKLLKEMSFEKITKRFLVLPKFYYKQQPKTGKRLRFSAFDHDCAKRWEEVPIKGLTLYGYNSSFLREGMIGVNGDGNSISVHEIGGHLLKKAVQDLYPNYSKWYDQELSEAYNYALQTNRFVTRYSKTDLEEFHAEHVAAYFSDQNRLKFWELNPIFYKTLESFLHDE